VARHFARAAALLLGSLAAGCSLLTDVGSLIAPAGDGGNGADAADAATRDSSSDARDDVDAAALDAPPAGRFCDSVMPQPTFCDDFDVGMFGANWNMPNIVGPGAALSADAFARSPPTALRAAAGTPLQQAYANITKDFSGTTRIIDYAFDLYVERKSTGSDPIEVCDVGVNANGDTYYVAVLLGNTDYVLAEHDPPMGNGESMSIPISSPLPTKKWVRVAFRIDYAPAMGSPNVTFSIDGVVGLSTALPAYGWKPGTAWAQAGIGWAGSGSTGGEVLVDNVVVRLTP
jgi:hypothetical protein